MKQIEIIKQNLIDRIKKIKTEKDLEILTRELIMAFAYRDYHLCICNINTRRKKK